MKAFTLCALLVPLAALAESPFDGTWVMKEDSAALDQKPSFISLAKGVWENKASVPPVEVKADGTDQPVKGHAYYDTVAVKSAGADSVEVTHKKGGKVTMSILFSVSADGKTATQKYTDLTGTEPVTGEILFERVGAVPAGAHAVSGSWRAKKIQSTSANGRTITYKATPDGMSMSTPTGLRYSAKFDGKEVKLEGDPGGTTVALKKVNASTIIETDRRLGKVAEVDHMTVTPDGKTLKVDWEDPQSHRKGSYVLEKQ